MTTRRQFLLASATPLGVTATVDTPAFVRGRVVPAQVMRIQEVAGFQEDVVRRGLRTSAGAATRWDNRMTAGQRCDGFDHIIDDARGDCRAAGQRQAVRPGPRQPLYGRRAHGRI